MGAAAAEDVAGAVVDPAAVVGAVTEGFAPPNKFEVVVVAAGVAALDEAAAPKSELVAVVAAAPVVAGAVVFAPKSGAVAAAVAAGAEAEVAADPAGFANSVFTAGADVVAGEEEAGAVVVAAPNRFEAGAAVEAGVPPNNGLEVAVDPAVAPPKRVLVGADVVAALEAPPKSPLVGADVAGVVEASGIRTRPALKGHYDLPPPNRGFEAGVVDAFALFVPKLKPVVGVVEAPCA